VVQEASTDTGESPFADTATPAATLALDTEEHPAPSSNGHDSTENLHNRVNSNPPILPEISTYQRTFSPTTFSAPFDNMMPPSVPGKNGVNPSSATAVTAPAPPGKRPDTTFGVLDLNDAYDGI
jgi:hypothetical protein